MEKNTTNITIHRSYNNISSPPESLGVWDKLFTSIKLSPAFQTIGRVSSRPREPTPILPRTTPVFAPKTIEIQTTNKPAYSDHHDLDVPIKLIKSSTSTARDRDVAIESSRSNMAVIKGVVDNDPLNKVFSDYIDRARSKIIAVPDHIKHDHQKNSDGDRTVSFQK